MKTLIILLILTPLFAIAQWPITYGHSTFDMIGRSLAIAYDDGVYITGAERLTNGGQLTAYVLKTDINGIQLWKRYIGDKQNYSNVLGVSQQPDGGIVISGETFQFGNIDGFSMKLNSCGEKMMTILLYQREVLFPWLVINN
jgi:hypothetical protein